jgi:hypothetical protein
MNCDQEGALLYAQIAKRQIEECATAREIDSADILNNAEYETTYIEPEPEPVKKGFFGKMFKK